MSINYQHSLLFVDDEESITNSLKRIFRKENFQILTATSGEGGLEVLKNAEKPVSLIISDQRMPNMNGAEFLEKAKKINPDAIRILLTGYSDMNAIVDAINKGEIHRYLTKPWNDEDLIMQVRQSLEQVELVAENRRLMELTARQNKELSELNRDLEKKVEERTEEIRKNNNELEKANTSLQKSFFDTIRLMSSLITTLNPPMGKYMSHTAQLSREIAESYGLSKEELDRIEMAGMIHDIGLLGLPDRILDKNPKDMDPNEYKMFSYHPLIASTCLEAIEQLSEVGNIILYHHECYNGTGFPNGLKGNDIPLGSRIIGVVSDYCRIVDTWPRDVKRIISKAKMILGDAANDIRITELDSLVEDVAKRVILFGAKHRYDDDVIARFIKDKIKNNNRMNLSLSSKHGHNWIALNKIREGMVLMKDIRIKDGRLLLVHGSVLDNREIDTIRKLGALNIVEDKVCIISDEKRGG